MQNSGEKFSKYKNGPPIIIGKLEHSTTSNDFLPWIVSLHLFWVSTQQKYILIFGQYPTKSGHSVGLVELGKRAQQLCAQSAKLLKLPPLSFVLTPDSSAPHICSFLPRKSKSYFRLLLHTYFYLGWVKKNLDMGLKVRFSFEKSFLVQSKFISKDKIILISQFYLN